MSWSSREIDFRSTCVFAAIPKCWNSIIYSSISEPAAHMRTLECFKIDFAFGREKSCRVPPDTCGPGYLDTNLNIFSHRNAIDTPARTCRYLIDTTFLDENKPRIPNVLTSTWAPQAREFWRKIWSPNILKWWRKCDRKVCTTDDADPRGIQKR